jgi:hypothetical protein
MGAIDFDLGVLQAVHRGRLGQARGVVALAGHVADQDFGVSPAREPLAGACRIFLTRSQLINRTVRLILDLACQLLEVSKTINWSTLMDMKSLRICSATAAIFTT